MNNYCCITQHSLAKLSCVFILKDNFRFHPRCFNPVNVPLTAQEALCLGGGGVDRRKRERWREVQLDWPGSLAAQTLQQQQDEDGGGPRRWFWGGVTGPKADHSGPDRTGPGVYANRGHPFFFGRGCRGTPGGEGARTIPHNPQAVMMVVMRGEQSAGILQSPTQCATNPQPSVSRRCRDKHPCVSPSNHHRHKTGFPSRCSSQPTG